MPVRRGFARLACRLAVILIGESAAPVSTPTAAGPRYSASGLGARFVHFQVTSAQLFSVQSRNRLGGFFIVGHFHKGEAASTASLSVHHQVDACHLSERFE